MMKLKQFGYLSMLFILLLVAGCGQDTPAASGTAQEEEGQPASAEKEQPSEKISIILDWYPNAVHSALYTALAKDYFAEEGVEVEIQMPADANDPLKLVAAGQADLALSYQPQVVMARAEGIPVKAIAAMVRHPLNYVMVPESSTIQSPVDLVGKTVGYPAIPLQEAMTHTMVKTAGGDPAQVTLVDVGWDLVPALATGKTDALMGGYINHEKLILEKQGLAIRAFNPTEFGVPDYYELVVVASEKGLEEKMDLYKKFWSAVSKGQQYVSENPAEGLGYLLEHEDKTFPLEKDIEEKSLEVLLPLMDAGDQPFGYQEQKAWVEVANWLYEQKLISEPVSGDQVFINIVE